MIDMGSATTAQFDAFQDLPDHLREQARRSWQGREEDYRSLAGREPGATPQAVCTCPARFGLRARNLCGHALDCPMYAAWSTGIEDRRAAKDPAPQPGEKEPPREPHDDPHPVEADPRKVPDTRNRPPQRPDQQRPK